jgi:hypothetical protein
LLLKTFDKDEFGGKTIEETNRVFRNVLREAVQSKYEAVIREVEKRRERGRLIRSMVVPVLMTLWLLLEGHGLLVRLLAQVAGVAIFLLMYAYCEVTLYQECTLARSA